MDFRRLDYNNLADYASNVRARLAGPELQAIDPAVRAALLATIGDLPELLAAQTAKAVTIENRRRSAVSARNETAQGMLHRTRPSSQYRERRQGATS
jgi:hypothetical protein